MLIVGIDLAGSEKRNTGICILDEKLNASCLTLNTDKEIIELIKKVEPKIIAIDAPLSLPIGRKNLKKVGPHLRECDRILLKLKIKFFPLSLGPMRKLTHRGIKLKKKFERLGFRVIEVYPGATQDILKIPRKQKGLENLKKGLINLGIRINKENINADELDAITAAYTAYLFLKKEAIEIGNRKEGTIVIPKIKSLQKINSYDKRG